MPDNNPFDPARIALNLKETDSAVAQLQQQLTSATQTMGSALQSVQIDIRDISKKMDSVTLLSARQENVEDEIGRAFSAIKELANTSASKWNEHHGTEKLDKEKRDGAIRASREKLILWGGIIGGFSILASILTGIVAWSVTSRFENQSRDHDKLDGRLNTYIIDSDKVHEEQEDKVEKIEKYLIRGGQNPDEPYNGGNK